MNPISAAYLERKLRAILGLSGGNPIPTLPDVRGFITLENDRPEWALAANELLMMFHAGAAQAVGELAYIAFTNPTGSGVLAIFEELRSMTVPGTGGATNPWAVHYDLAATALAGVLSTSTGSARDMRLIPAGSSSGNFGAIVTQVGNDVTPSATATRVHPVLSGATNGQQADVYQHPIILPPGRRIILIAEAVNTVIAAGATWRERAVEGLVELK